MNLDLCIHCVPKMNCFAVNHHNYARGLVLLHDKLLKLKIALIEIHIEFENGCFPSKRTKKHFPTLKEIINTNTTGQITGIKTIFFYLNKDRLKVFC